MDILAEKLVLIDAIDCKINQLEQLKAQLINEHNDEVKRRQQVAAEKQQATQVSAQDAQQVKSEKKSK